MDHADHTDNKVTGGKGKRLLRIVACICVSAVLWLFTTLSGQFESEVSVSLQYDLPADQTTTRKLPGEARLLVRTTGWQLIREEFRERALEIDISNTEGRETFITNQRKELFIADMPSDIEVLKIAPDTILLHLERRITKKVPVVLSMTEPALPLYIDSISISPDTITLSGPESVLHTIDQWTTEPVFSLPDSVVNGIIPMSESAFPEIQLSAVACRYYLAEATAEKGQVSGVITCHETGETLSVTMLYYSKTPTTFSFSDLHIHCFHQDGHMPVIKDRPEDMVGFTLSLQTNDHKIAQLP